MCVKFLITSFITVLYFSTEIMSFTDTFLGNHTLHINDLAVVEKSSKRPRLHVLFSQKIEGKSGASDTQKNVSMKRSRLNVFLGHGGEKTVLTVLNRLKRYKDEDKEGESSSLTIPSRSGVPIPGEKPLTIFDPEKAKLPGPQTQEYYGFVPFSVKKLSDNPNSLSSSAEKTSGHEGFASKSYTNDFPSSSLVTDYGHSSLFPDVREISKQMKTTIPMASTAASITSYFASSLSSSSEDL